jgi:hypothetical protein
MQLGIESQIPDGLLAANALLAENSRLGVPTSTHTLHRGFEFAISSTVLGFRFGCSETASDPVVAPNNATCQLSAPGGNYNLGPNAVALFQPQMSAALTNAFNFLNSQGITPTINSGFRSPADQIRMQNGGSGPNPAATVSWHQAGMAVDINGTSSSFFPTIISAMQAQGLTWGGTFTHRDPPHFQLPRPGTSPSAATVKACAAAAGGHG